jgi:S-(hydroxymethyl)glutathione dehydrogenase/alcohol dehydrogenase
MRAAVLERPGVATRIEELTLDEPRAGEVLVRMAASGVCHSDLHVRDGDWERPGPIVLGHEGAGYVEALGQGVEGLRPGELVALSWYAPCLRCRGCLSGRQWLCSESPSVRHKMTDGTSRIHRSDGEDVYTYLSIGTFSERSVVPETAAVPMPDGTPPEVAALIGCCVTTGVGAVLKTANVPDGSSVLVVGLGGVGLSIVMGAVLAGADRVVAVDRLAAKLELARELGATHAIRAGEDPGSTAAAIKAACGPDRPDFAFEAIGLPVTIELAISVLPPGGTAVLVGLTPFGARASLEVFPFVDGSRRILGSNYGSAEAAIDFPRYAEDFLAGRLPIDRLIDRRLRIDELEDAFERMRRGEHVRQVVTDF